MVHRAAQANFITGSSRLGASQRGVAPQLTATVHYQHGTSSNFEHWLMCQQEV
jgi:hypothetical protein